jgi:hypothetical protein
MKRILNMVSLLVTAVCLMPITESKRATAATKPSPAAVVLQCSLAAEFGRTAVLAVDGTSGSPTIATGSSCAAAVLLLVTNGFTIEGVHTFSGYAIFYTMVRTT